MKKLNLAGMFGLLALFSVCLFTSCSDDDDEGGSASELVGTWQSTHVIEWEKENGNYIDYYDEDDDDLKLVLHADGTFENYLFEYNRWRLDSTGTWSYKDGVITARGYYEEYYDEEWYEDKMTVITLNSTTLVVEGYGTDEDGIELYSKYSYRKIANE